MQDDPLVRSYRQQIERTRAIADDLRTTVAQSRLLVSVKVDASATWATAGRRRSTNRHGYRQASGRPFGLE